MDKIAKVADKFRLGFREIWTANELVQRYTNIHLKAEFHLDPHPSVEFLIYFGQYIPNIRLSVLLDELSTDPVSSGRKNAERLIRAIGRADL